MKINKEGIPNLPIVKIVMSEPKVTIYATLVRTTAFNSETRLTVHVIDGWEELHDKFVIFNNEDWQNSNEVEIDSVLYDKVFRSMEEMYSDFYGVLKVPPEAFHEKEMTLCTPWWIINKAARTTVGL